MAKSKPWAKETDLCADFMIWAKAAGWDVYPEHGGWDILLVRPEDGFQIGVEAKLSLNAKVLCQVLSKNGDYRFELGAPDIHAVLVPDVDCVIGLGFIARHLDIVVIEGWMRTQSRYVKGTFDMEHREVADFRPMLPRLSDWSSHVETWPERCPDKRVTLPEYVPDCIAGDKSPVMLTEWKIKAIKVMIVIEIMGSVTRADFKALKIDASRWTQYWLRSDGIGGWVLKDGSSRPDFRFQHPVNYEQIKSDFDVWSKVLPPRLLRGVA